MISVIICTYNRADLLVNALQTLCEQSLDASKYEIIVVDNNSTDNTRPVTESLAQQYPNVRYCFEPQQGLSHARNRGWQEAEREYVIYIDDDCVVPSGTLGVASKIIEQHFPDLFGGPFEPFYEGRKPPWYKDSYGGHAPFEQAQFIQHPDSLYGEHFGVRRKLLEEFGGFDPTLGMVGNQISYGEETAFFRKLVATRPNSRLYYEPQFLVYHLVRPEKMTWHWLIRDRFTKGRYISRVYQGTQANKSQAALIGGLLITSLLLPLDALILSLLRNREKQPYWQQYLYESSLEHVKRLGRLYDQYQHL